MPIQDGDQRDKGGNKNDFLFLPIEDVEQEFASRFVNDRNFKNKIISNCSNNIDNFSNKNDPQTVKEICDLYKTLKDNKDNNNITTIKDCSKKLFKRVIDFLSNCSPRSNERHEQYIISNIITELKNEDIFKQFKQDLENRLKERDKK